MFAHLPSIIEGSSRQTLRRNNDLAGIAYDNVQDTTCNIQMRLATGRGVLQEGFGDLGVKAWSVVVLRLGTNQFLNSLALNTIALAKTEFG